MQGEPGTNIISSEWKPSAARILCEDAKRHSAQESRVDRIDRCNAAHSVSSTSEILARSFPMRYQPVPPPMEADPADSCQSPSIMSRIRVIGDFFGNSCNTTLVQGFFPGSRLLTAFQNYHRRWQGGILPWVPGGFNPTLATKKWSYSSPSRHSTAHCFLERKKVRRLCSLLRVID